MEKSRIIIFLIALFIAICPVKAQIDDSYLAESDSIITIDTVNVQDFDQISNNLDSLLQLWYLTHNSSNELKINELDTVIPIFSDSVYIRRISNIKSFFPLTYNEVVRRFIELYTIKRRKQVEFMLGLSEYYFPIFEEILDTHDIPLELKYLPIIESALNPRARSRAGATGLWQFMYSTGKMYKLEINSFVDERCDPIKSTKAAAKYLKQLYDIYQDWTLVIAAYNCGPGNVNRAIRRSGGNTDYWKIYYRLPRETRGYVPAFIAAVYMMTYAKEHNIYAEKLNFPIKTDTIMVNKQLHLQQVAEVLKISIEQLRETNPHYRRDIIPAGDGEKYPLLLPFDLTTKFIDHADSIYSYKNSFFFNPEQKFMKPPKYEAYKTDEPSIKGKEKVYYTVKNGDNLGYISNWFGVKVTDLKYWNNVYRNMIRVGEKLVIYVPEKKVEFYNKIDNMSLEEKQALSDKKTNYANMQTAMELDEKYVYHKIKQGENLWTIARKYQGANENEIMRLNNLDSYSVSKLQPGDYIKIKLKNN